MRPIRPLAVLLVFSLAASAGFAPAAAQEDEPTTGMYYIADYKVGFDDLPEWTADHRQHAVPLLDSLVAEEVITGWSAWQHHTGSDYNWRLVLEADDWPAFDTFWEEYLGRFPENALQRGAEMIRAHRDQVWNQGDTRFPDGASDVPLAYEARYQIDFADMGAWQEHFNADVVPVLEDAMAEGQLQAWVVQNHDTGDRFNRVEVFFFEDWDDIDDFWSRLLGELMADEEQWDRFAGMIRAHDDVIWERVPDAAGEGPTMGGP